MKWDYLNISNILVNIYDSWANIILGLENSLYDFYTSISVVWLLVNSITKLLLS